MRASGSSLRKPPWIRVRAGGGPEWRRLRELVRRHGLHTVCEEALCPNAGACWSEGRLTLMILGDTCSRSCAFCSVGSAAPRGTDEEEPQRVAAAVAALGVREVVLTSVTRDDLPDGGARLWAETLRRVRAAAPGALVEALVPDFGGSRPALDAVLAAAPDVLGHNLETVPSLYARVRPQADYGRSLAVLGRAHAAGCVTKTGLMLGLGETAPEVLAVMRAARQAGADILTLGQYLRPTARQLPVARYLPPEEFAELRGEGLRMGYAVVVAGPLVRSSFHSDEQTRFLRQRGKASEAVKKSPTGGGRGRPYQDMRKTACLPNWRDAGPGVRRFFHSF